MNGNREERAREALREAAAEFLAREASGQSLITVTNTMLSKDGRRAIVYITVLPEQFEEQGLSFANRHCGELAEFLNTKVRGMKTPHIEFAIDKGEKNRQRLDELTS